MRQGLLQIPRGVQHVGCDQQVAAVGIKALGDWVSFDVQRPVVDAAAAVAEPGLSLREESRGDIRIRVIEPAFGKLRKH